MKALYPASFLFLVSACALCAQGALDPAGPPGPGMKSLAEIDAKLERRTPLPAGASSINAPGSYYLTGSFTVGSGNGIVINVDDVTLDLNGFTIASTAASPSGAGVNIAGLRSNVTVRNGHIRGTTTVAAGTFTTGGFAVGVSAGNAGNANLRASEIHCVGIGGNGIQLLGSARTLVAERCQVSVCSGTGIEAGLVQECRVDSAGLTAVLGTTVTDTMAVSLSPNPANYGISAAISVQGSYGACSGGPGISVPGVIDRSYGFSTGGAGLSGTTVSNSAGTSTSSFGVTATVAANCVGTSTNGVGLSATEANNCTGTSSAGNGLSVTQNATNCTGTSSTAVGLSAGGNAHNCSATSTSGAQGMLVSGTAAFCRAKRDGGSALSCTIAVACTVNGTGVINATSKQLGTL